MTDIRPEDELPPDLAAGIGWLIVAYSHLEEMLSHICYDLAGLDDVAGRIAVRAPRMAERAEMIRDLAAHAGVTLDEKILKDLQHDTSRLSEFRDYIAHGTYYRSEDGRTYCRRTRGKWQPDKGSRPIRAVLKPVAYPLEAEELAFRLYRCAGQQVLPEPCVKTFRVS